MDMMESSQAKNKALLAALVKMAFRNSMGELEINQLIARLDKSLFWE